MRIGEMCGSDGAKVPFHGRDNEMESIEYKTTPHHRRTYVLVSGVTSVSEVISSKKSWIAVMSQDHVFVMPPDIVLDTTDFRLTYTNEPEAIVSFSLDTNEFHNESGFAASLAEFNEIMTICFLQEQLRKSPDLKYDDAMEITRHAFRLFSIDNKANELEPNVQKRKQIEDFKHAYKQTKILNSGRTYEGLRAGYKRETQIWCGGWDWQLQLQFFGFNWIAVQGEDSLCVVTRDEVCNKVLKELSYDLEVYPLFARAGYPGQLLKRNFTMCPFAVVSVNKCLIKVDAECCNEASDGEIEAVEFLAKQIENGPSFTFMVTVQTAIDALKCLIHKDMDNKDIQVCVLVKGKSPVRVNIPVNSDVALIKEIVKPLLGMMKPRKHKHNIDRMIRIFP